MQQYVVIIFTCILDLKLVTDGTILTKIVKIIPTITAIRKSTFGEACCVTFQVNKRDVGGVVVRTV